MTGKINKKAKYFDKNPIEAVLRGTADDVIATVKDDILESPEILLKARKSN